MSISLGLRIFRKVIGSLLAAVIGAGVGLMGMVLMGWDDWHTCFIMIGLFLVPIWALVLLPLHVLLPRSSSFWDPRVSTGVGGAVGAVLICIFFLFVIPHLLWLFLPIGGFVGTATGLAGSPLVRFPWGKDIRSQ